MQHFHTGALRVVWLNGRFLVGETTEKGRSQRTDSSMQLENVSRFPAEPYKRNETGLGKWMVALKCQVNVRPFISAP